MPIIGLGATISVNDGTGGAQTVIDDVVELEVPDPTVSIVESKRFNYLSDQTIRKLPSMKDPGEFSFKYEFSKVKKTRLDALVGVPHVFVITLQSDDGGTGGSAGTWVRTAPGVVTSNKLEKVSPDEIQYATCTVTVTGPVT